MLRRYHDPTTSFSHNITTSSSSHTHPPPTSPSQRDDALSTLSTHSPRQLFNTCPLFFYKTHLANHPSLPFLWDEPGADTAVALTDGEIGNVRDRRSSSLLLAAEWVLSPRGGCGEIRLRDGGIEEGKEERGLRRRRK
jgi:hypothetical protein